MAAVMAGLRVLVVEDDAELRTLTRMLLEDEGAEVAAAANGNEALALAGEFRPQVALLDARLPDMTGGDLGKKLREALPDCGQVLVSGDARGVAEWERIGGLALPKPYEIDELLALVHKAASLRCA